MGALGPQGQAHEPAAAEARQLVAVLEGLPHALHPFGEDAHQLALAQQPLAVLLARPHLAALGEEGREEGQEREHVEGQHPALAPGRALVADGELHHRPVVGQHARVVGDHEPGARRRDVLHSRGLDPPPHGVEELEEGLDGRGELRVVAVLVGLLRVPGEVDRFPEPRQVRPASSPRGPPARRRARATSGPPAFAGARAAARAPSAPIPGRAAALEPLDLTGLSAPRTSSRARARGDRAPGRPTAAPAHLEGTTLALFTTRPRPPSGSRAGCR